MNNVYLGISHRDDVVLVHHGIKGQQWGVRRAQTGFVSNATARVKQANRKAGRAYMKEVKKEVSDLPGVRAVKAINRIKKGEQRGLTKSDFTPKALGKAYVNETKYEISQLPQVRAFKAISARKNMTDAEKHAEKAKNQREYDGIVNRQNSKAKLTDKSKSMEAKTAANKIKQNHEDAKALAAYKAGEFNFGTNQIKRDANRKAYLNTPTQTKAPSNPKNKQQAAIIAKNIADKEQISKVTNMKLTKIAEKGGPKVESRVLKAKAADKMSKEWLDAFSNVAMQEAGAVSKESRISDKQQMANNIAKEINRREEKRNKNK